MTPTTRNFDRPKDDYLSDIGALPTVQFDLSLNSNNKRIIRHVVHG